MQEVIKYLEDKIIEDIKVYDITGKSIYNDFVIIGTAKNNRQMEALVASIRKDLAHILVRQEGINDWVVFDLGESIVHIFDEDTRAEYNLDRMYK
jgi:ribosome-associated protein